MVTGEWRWRWRDCDEFGRFFSLHVHSPFTLVDKYSRSHKKKKRERERERKRERERERKKGKEWEGRDQKKKKNGKLCRKVRPWIAQSPRIRRRRGRPRDPLAWQPRDLKPRKMKLVATKALVVNHSIYDQPGSFSSHLHPWPITHTLIGIDICWCGACFVSLASSLTTYDLNITRKLAARLAAFRVFASAPAQPTESLCRIHLNSPRIISSSHGKWKEFYLVAYTDGTGSYL